MCMFVLNAIDRNIPWTPPHSLPISVDCCINFTLKCIINLKLLKVLIFCAEFRELSHLKRDLSQAEKKITNVTVTS